MASLQEVIDGLTEVEDPTDPKDPTVPNEDDGKGTIDTDKGDQGGEKLPATATNMFKFLGMGMLLLAVGIGGIF